MFWVVEQVPPQRGSSLTIKDNYDPTALDVEVGDERGIEIEG